MQLQRFKKKFVKQIWLVNSQDSVHSENGTTVSKKECVYFFINFQNILSQNEFFCGE